MGKQMLLLGVLLALSGSVLAQGATERQERYDLAYKIVSEWGPYVKGIYGEPVGPWAKRLTPTLQQADTAKLRAAANADTFEGMMNGLTGARAPNPKLLPGGVAPKDLGDLAADLVFTPLAQCNLVDTRVAGGPFTGVGGRHFQGSGVSFAAQGGSNTNCGIPSNVTALLLGVTAVNQTAKGFFRIWPYGQPIPATSSMSYGPTQNTRNDIVVRMSQGLAADFSALASTGGGHLLISVLGYYAPPEATALHCQGTAASVRTIAAGYNGYADAPACPSGYTATVPYCWSSAAGVYLKGSGLNSNTAGARTFCHWQNTSGAPRDVYEGTMCCRVPGR